MPQTGSLSSFLPALAGGGAALRLLVLGREMLGWRRHKLVHAGGRAEIVSLPLMLRLTTGLERVHRHPTDGIDDRNIDDPVLRRSPRVSFIPFPLAN